ncbi:MAG: acyl-CoA thioesterase [Bacteroidetes bacterium CG12_big_fil_rev_8_21_14_0_65_60_17]|nr:MAG: acyl-CoA thioesterase [Bacteroidetes bacterium CG12_big_fil_rev_8_21_14_0_65_60_17]
MNVHSGAQRAITLRFLAQPTDVNFGGNVHGGSAMKWLDQAGYVCATTWSSRYCVTAFVGDINFHKPIRVGSLVEARARIIHTGRTSMHIVVDLYSCVPTGCDMERSVRCIMVFIAVDEDGKPVRIPRWEPETEDDRRLEAYAMRIMELRKVNQAEIETLKV